MFTNSDEPKLVTACYATLLVLYTARYVIHKVWRKWFHCFEQLPPKLRRHDSNMLTRVFAGMVTAPINVYIVCQLLTERTWAFSHLNFLREFGVIHTTADLYDMTQRRKFDHQVVVHHGMEALLTIAWTEWLAREYSDPIMVFLMLIGTVGRLDSYAFPLLRVGTPEQVKAGGKVALLICCFSFLLSLGSLVAYVSIYWEDIHMGWCIIAPIFYMFFVGVDIGIFYMLRKLSDGRIKSCPVMEIEEDDHELDIVNPIEQTLARLSSNIRHSLRSSFMAIRSSFSVMDENNEAHEASASGNAGLARPMELVIHEKELVEYHDKNKQRQTNNC
jgi:hypothetical protein